MGGGGDGVGWGGWVGGAFERGVPGGGGAVAGDALGRACGEPAAAGGEGEGGGGREGI